MFIILNTDYLNNLQISQFVFSYSVLRIYIYTLRLVNANKSLI